MQTKTDPFAGGTESLATSGAGELQRLRWIFHVLTGWQDWYRTDQNLNFASGSGVQGSGLGRHVTAVGYHAWNTTLPAFPVITSIADHQTGFWFPLAGHVSLAIRDENVNGGAKGGIEMLRWHARGATFHHTAALRFAHSTSQMDGGQRGHVTVLQLNRGLPGAGGTSDDNSKNDAAYKDSLVIGHATVGIMIHGTGITGGANRLYGLSNDGRYLETKAISGSLTITHQAGQLVFGGSTAAGLWASRGAITGLGFNTADGGHIVTLRAHVVQLMNAATHANTIRVNPASIAVNLNDNTSGDNNGATPNGRDRKQTFEINTWVYVYWIFHSGSSLLRGVMSPNNALIGPNLPTGFDSWALAAAYRRSSTNIAGFVAMHTAGTLALYAPAQSVLTGGTATSVTTVDLSTVVPPDAVSSYLHITAASSTGQNATVSIRNRTYGSIGGFPAVFTLRGGMTGAGGPAMNTVPVILVNDSQRIFYSLDVAGFADIEVLGFIMPNGGS